MRKLTTLLLFVVVCAPLPAQSFDQEAIPLYSLAFDTSQGVHIASLLTDNTWRIDSPPVDVYFGQFDIIDCSPVWSSDGHQLLFMVGTDNSPDDEITMLSQVGSYDVFTQTLQVHSNLFDTALDSGFCIESVSPHGRYAWLNNTMMVKSALVDLQVGTVIALKPYLVHGIAWHEDRVFVSIWEALNFDGWAEQFVLALPGGEPIVTFPHYQDAAEQYVSEAFWLDDNRIVFTVYMSPEAAYDSLMLGIAHVEQGIVNYSVDDVYGVMQLSADRHSIAYRAADRRLMVLNVDTMEPFSPGGSSLYYGWRGNTLVTVRASETQPVTYTYATYEGQTCTTEQVLDLDGVTSIQVNPDTQTILAASGGLSLYQRDGGLLAGPELVDLEGNPVQLSGYHPQLVWGRTHAYFMTSPGGSVAIDTTTGELLFASQGYLWVGESPDGQWALLAGDKEGMAPFHEDVYPELLAYSFETGQKLTLFAETGEMIYGPIYFSWADTLPWRSGGRYSP